MVQNIILAAVLIAAFFLSVSAFLFGLKLGKTIGESKLPTVTINPVKKVIQAVEQHEVKKEETKLQNEFEDVMGATKESMLQAIESGVK